ncbi:MAG: hypothetical protein ACOYO1_12700 [Bacteroidales bacterium]
MNIILLNKKLLLLFVFFIFVNYSYEQEKNSLKKGYSLSLTAGNGIIANIDQNKKLTDNIFYSPSLRFLWKPDHILNIGIESAYLTVSKQDSTLASTAFGATALRARLNAIPILVVFNMKVSKIDLYYGIGLSYVTSRLEAFGEKVVVNNWYYCYDIAVAYTHPFSKNINIGIEGKSYFFPKLQKVSGGIVINFSYRILSW